MDHYSIIEPPSPRQNEKDSEIMPEETATGSAEDTNQPLLRENSGSPPAPLETVPNETAAQPILAEQTALPELRQTNFEPPREESAADLDMALQAIVQKAQYISNATGAAIALRQDGDVVCRAASGSSAPDRGARLEIKSGLTAECLRSGELMRCDDVMLDSRVNLESCKRLGIESIIIMPLHRKGSLVGVLELFSAHAYSFQERDVEMVRGLAEEIGRTLVEAERQDHPSPRERGLVALPVEEGSTCSSCGAQISDDAVFCTECGGFQESKPKAKAQKLPAAWRTRLNSRRLLVPAVFVAMALAVAVVPIPRTSTRAVPRTASSGQAPPATTPRNVGQEVKPNAAGGSSGAQNPATNGSPAAANPSIASSVKQLLGGVSSDFSKLLPVNEKAEPVSSGDPNLRVWVDTRKGFYYCPGDEQYGHTDKGAFMTQKQAESNYYIPALIKPCM